MTYARYKKIYPFILIAATLISVIVYLLIQDKQKDPDFIAAMVWFLLAGCSFPLFLAQFPIFSDLNRENKERRARLVGGIKHAADVYDQAPPEQKEAVDKFLAHIFHGNVMSYHQKQEEIARVKSSTAVYQATATEKQALARKIELENEINAERKNLIALIVREMNLNNITYEQMHLLIKIIDPNADPKLDFYAKRELTLQELEKMKEETEKLKHSGRKEKAQADLEEYNVQQDIRENEDRKGRKSGS